MDNGKAGIVTPANNNTNKSASILLPIYGNKDNPPSAMYFVEQALTYLRTRELVRLNKMSQSLDALRYRASYDPDPLRRALRQSLPTIPSTTSPRIIIRRTPRRLSGPL